MNGEKLPKCLRFVLPAAACNFNSYEANSGLFFKTGLGSSVEKDIFGRGACGRRFCATAARMIRLW